MVDDTMKKNPGYVGHANVSIPERRQDVGRSGVNAPSHQNDIKGFGYSFSTSSICCKTPIKDNTNVGINVCTHDVRVGYSLYRSNITHHSADINANERSRDAMKNSVDLPTTSGMEILRGSAGSGVIVHASRRNHNFLPHYDTVLLSNFVSIKDEPSKVLKCRSCKQVRVQPQYTGECGSTRCVLASPEEPTSNNRIDSVNAISSSTSEKYDNAASILRSHRLYSSSQIQSTDGHRKSFNQPPTKGISSLGCNDEYINGGYRPFEMMVRNHDHLCVRAVQHPAHPRNLHLSPLTTPYDAYSLTLHPFSCFTASALPSEGMALSDTVDEVALDYMARIEAGGPCDSCRASVDTKRVGTDKLNAYHDDDSNSSFDPCHKPLQYRTFGSGPENVILVHGICMSGSFFIEGILKYFFPEGVESAECINRQNPGTTRKSDKYHLNNEYAAGDLDSSLFTFFCVDLLGYGRSAYSCSTQNYTRREQAMAILRDVILKNGLTSVHLVGHSFGSLVSAELCLLLPLGFVGSLIMLSPAYFESERQATQILLATHFPASNTVAHPYFGEFLVKFCTYLRTFLEPLVLCFVPGDELPQLSVVDLFSIHPDAVTGTVRTIVQDRVDRTFQLLQERGQRIALIHGAADGVVPIRQAEVLVSRNPNIQLRSVPGFVHHFPSSHALFTARIIEREIKQSLRCSRRLLLPFDGSPSNAFNANRAILTPGHPTW